MQELWGYKAPLLLLDTYGDNLAITETPDYKTNLIFFENIFYENMTNANTSDYKPDVEYFGDYGYDGLLMMESLL